MIKSDPVKLAFHQSVAHLELTRPNAENSIGAAMDLALDNAVTSIESDPKVRALLISGQGLSFCLGGDLD